MRNRKIIIYIVMSFFILLFPLGYLLGVIEDKIAFPSIFILLACQSLFNGFFIFSKNNKSLRNVSLIIGSFLLLFALLYALPTYYL